MVGAGSTDVQAQRNAAVSAYKRGDKNALDLVKRALKASPNDGGLLISEAALRVSFGDSDALSQLVSIVGRVPDWVDGQVALAEFRWGSDDSGGYLRSIEDALKQLPQHSGLWKAYIGLLAGTGRSGDAADAAGMARKHGFDLPMLRLIEAMHSGAAGDQDRAEALFANLPDELPDLPFQLARHRVRMGKADEAVSLLDEARRRHPEDVSVWALTEICWRLTEDTRHDWLVRQDELTGSMNLGLSKTNLAKLAELLRTLHGSNAQPVGQSVRSGTQTRGDIFKRIEPAIVDLRTTLTDAVIGFWSDLPECDPEHPLLRYRDAVPALVTGWSIRIREGGFHVSHVHPGGALSSAFYVAIPNALDAARQEGWIELGRPPADLRLDLDPLLAFEPKPGRLVLFPSYLYHGTRRFTDGERLSVAFDVAAQ